MRFVVALREALKYHAASVVPNLIGGAIVAIALWIGVVDPATTALSGAPGGPEGLLEALLAAPYNLPVAVVGVVGGLLLRRIGKTALLFRIHGTTVVDVVDDDLTEDDPASTSSVEDSRGGFDSGGGDVHDGAGIDTGGSATNDTGTDDVVEDTEAAVEPTVGEPDAAALEAEETATEADRRDDEAGR